MSDDGTQRDDDERFDDEGHRLRDRLENLLPNVIRRGVGAKQYTEDVIRGALSDVKLPREAVNHLIDVADNTKKEVVRVAAREFREFLESAKFNEELAKILTQLSFEIRTEIRFVPNDQALKPSVSTKARVRTKSGETVDASPSTNASINEAVRSNATELVEMFLGRVLKSGLSDLMDEGADDTSESEEQTDATEEGADVEKEPAKPKPKPKSTPRKKRTSSRKKDAASE